MDNIYLVCNMFIVQCTTRFGLNYKPSTGARNNTCNKDTYI